MLTQSERQILEANSLFKELAWEPLDVQGTSNRLYKARVTPESLELVRGNCTDTHWILRWHADEQVSFGVDRTLEQEVLMSIDGNSWSPDLIYLDPQGRFIVLPLYQNASEPLSLYSIKPILAQFQTITNVPAMRYSILFQQYRKALANDAEGLELLAKLLHLFQALPDKNHSLVHHDLHLGNMVFEGSQLKIIDWEYAGLGCPWLDLAAVASFCELTYQDIQELPVGHGLTKQNIVKWMKIATAFNQILAKLWYRVREG